MGRRGSEAWITGDKTPVIVRYLVVAPTGMALTGDDLAGNEDHAEEALSFTAQADDRGVRFSLPRAAS